MLQATYGNFYVTENGPLDIGTICKLKEDGTLTDFYHFCSFSVGSDCRDGARPARNALIQGTDGSFYGTTQLGGKQRRRSL